jgi:hypothetical protein
MPSESSSRSLAHQGLDVSTATARTIDGQDVTFKTPKKKNKRR